MKWPRKLLLGLAAACAVAVALGLAAFNSRIQTWAVRRELSARPWLGASVGAVSAGWGSVRIDNLRIERDGAVLTVPAVEARLPVLYAVLERRVLVRGLVAKGWTLDLARAGRAAPPGPAGNRAPAPGRNRSFSLLPSARAAGPNPPEAAVALFGGVLSRIRLPFDLALDGVELDGDVVVPARSDFPGGTAEVSVSGGGVAPGGDGRFEFGMDFEAFPAGSPLASLSFEGTLGVSMDSPRTFSRLSARVAASASGAKFPQGVRLGGDAAASRTADGETYSVSLAGDSRDLLSLDADFPYKGARLSGTWQLDVSDPDIAPFALGRALPAFSAVGNGRFDTDAAFAEVHASGGLGVTADRLGSIRPELASVGAVRLASDFDVTRRGSVFRMDRLSASLEGAQPILKVAGLQPFAFNAATGQLEVADASRDLVSVELQGVPPGWSQEFLPGVALSGSPVKGSLAMRASGGGLEIRAATPIAVGDFAAVVAGRPVLHGVAVSIDPSADWAPAGWQVQATGRVSASAGPGGDAGAGPAPVAIAGFSLKFGRLRAAGEPVKAAASLDADLPALLGHLDAGGAWALSRGTLKGSLTASLGAHVSVDAALNLDDLSAQAPLPAVGIKVRADWGPDGKVTASIPVLVDRGGRKSDFTLSGALSPSGAGWLVDGRLDGGAVTVGDLEVLGSAFGAQGAPGAANPGAGAAGGSPGPFWGGFRGRVAVALGKVDGLPVPTSDVSAALRLEPAALSFDSLRATLGAGGDVKADGSLAYDAGKPDAYALRARLTGDDLDFKPFFQWADPARPAIVEGRFDVVAQASADAPDPAGIAARLRGDFHLTSKGGTFRALSMGPLAKAQNLGKVAAIGAFLGNMASALTGRKDAADISSAAQAVSDFSKSLAAIPYDQLSVEVVRGDAPGLALKDFALISPELRLQGSGLIGDKDGTPFADQGLSLNLTLGARGRAADLLKYAGILDPKPDGFGYAACTIPLNVSGTVSRPDTGDIQAALLKAAVDRSGAGELLNKLLGK
jgi:hypothetical protein